MTTITDCRYCDQPHDGRFLCDPARRFLEAEQGQRFDMPTMELDEPFLEADAFGAGTVLLKQLVVLAATVPVAGVPRPMLIFTGTDAEGKPLPRWLYPGAASEIRRAIKLVSDMGELAIRTARKQAGATT
jgi:hypothetical protein